MKTTIVVKFKERIQPQIACELRKVRWITLSRCNKEFVATGADYTTGLMEEGFTSFEIVKQNDLSKFVEHDRDVVRLSKQIIESVTFSFP